VTKARILSVLGLGLMLSGCASGFAQWRNAQDKTRNDLQHARTERRERDNYANCVDQGAMPGSPENLACQLDLAQKQQKPAKPQDPPPQQQSP
jgi:hypothetical protein